MVWGPGVPKMIMAWCEAAALDSAPFRVKTAAKKRTESRSQVPPDIGTPTTAASHLLGVPLGFSQDGGLVT